MVGAGRKPVRILHATSRYPPAIGGVEHHLSHIVRSLRSRGHSVEVLASDLMQVPGERIPTPERLSEARYLRSLTLPFAKRYPLIPGIVPALIRARADVWHAHAFWFWPGDAVLGAARVRRHRVVASPYFYTMGREARHWHAYLRIAGRWLEHADLVTVISRYEQRLMAAYGIRPRRVELVTPGVDLDEFDVSTEAPWRRLGVEGRDVVLFVGRLSYEKGADVLLRAAPAILDADRKAAIVIAGPDFGEGTRLRHDAETLGKRVVFAGQLPRHELLAAYREAAVFVLPTRYEAFGIVCVEAMASRTAVVSTNAAAVPEVVRDGVDGLLVEAGDSDALGAAVSRLLCDEELRQRLGENGRSRVEAEFSYPKIIDQLVGLYESVTDGKHH